MRKFRIHLLAVMFLLLVFITKNLVLQVIQLSLAVPKLQVARGSYDAEIIPYIQANWTSFLGRDELDTYAHSKIEIGEPYGIYSLDKNQMIDTQFPMYVDGKCIQVLTVFKDKTGKLTWSATISKEFLQLIDDLKLKVGKYRFETKDSPSGGVPYFALVPLDERTSDDGVSYSDISKPIITLNPLKVKKTGDDKSSDYPYKKILPMEPSETQTDKPWCVCKAHEDKSGVITPLFICLQIF